MCEGYDKEKANYRFWHKMFQKDVDRLILSMPILAQKCIQLHGNYWAKFFPLSKYQSKKIVSSGYNISKFTEYNTFNVD